MSFQLTIQNNVYTAVVQDAQMIALWEANYQSLPCERNRLPRLDTYLPPNLKFPQMVMLLTSKEGGDDFTEDGKLYIDVWNARTPGENESFSYAVRDRLHKILNKKIMADAAGNSCRFYYSDKYKKPVLVDGNLVESEISCFTIVFKLRIVDASLNDAAIYE